MFKIKYYNPDGNSVNFDTYCPITCLVPHKLQFVSFKSFYLLHSILIILFAKSVYNVNMTHKLSGENIYLDKY
jgi:hypothetical protein